jgi:hypothetical protein
VLNQASFERGRLVFLVGKALFEGLEAFLEFILGALDSGIDGSPDGAWGWRIL